MSHNRASERLDALLRGAVQQARYGILITDADVVPGGQRIVFANTAMADMTGYAVDEIIGRTPRMFQGPRTDRSELDRIRAALARGEPVRAELVNYAKDGREYVVEIDIAPLGDQIALDHFVAFQHDITAQRAESESLEPTQVLWRLAELVREALDNPIDETYMHRVFEQAVQAVPGTQAGSLKLIADDGHAHFVAVEGYDKELLNASFPAEYILEDFPGRSAVVKRGFSLPPEMDPENAQLLYGDVGRATEIRASLGIPLWIGGRLRGLLNLDNFESEDAFTETSVAIGLLYGRLLERADQQIEVSRQLGTDTVTGLPVRSHGEAALSRLLAGIEQRSGAFMLLNLDDFKMVNDAYGHQVGDRIIREVGARLRRTVGPMGTVTRWTGDEFMILLPEVQSERALFSVARSLLNVIERPFHHGSQEISLTGSLGVVRLPQHASNASEAIQHALIAVHRAKLDRKGGVVIFQPEMMKQVTRRVRIDRDLRTAIHDGSIYLHYQPRFDLASGEMVAAEALARWNHPELGRVPPSEFIALAEETGLIHALGEHVLHVACKQAREWLDAGRPLRIAVNVSAKELQRAAFAHSVRRALEHVELPPRFLELEITESTAMADVAATIEIMKELGDLGVLLAIDDFGTAYSSLSYLQKLPVDALKIDRSFVMHLSDRVSEDPEESALVRGIVALAKSLRLTVVAEGVESNAQLAFLEMLDCDEAQGYFLARPGRPEDIDLGARTGPS